MASPEARSALPWIVIAHLLGAAALGGLEAGRLGGGRLGLVLVPLFAATGLVAGLVIGLATRLARGRRGAALILALPTLIITIPLASTLFDGAYAQTLPLAHVLPYAVPPLLWLVAAAAIALGGWLARGDFMLRVIAILGLGGAMGGLIWTTRNLLRGGYPGAHVAATITLIVLAGLALRLARVTAPARLAAVLAGLAIGSAAASAGYGLRAAGDRERLATFGDQGRDLVGLWRWILDRDRDGSSPLLGGGDCDDSDPSIHPGAIDIPGDGIDQDCDGFDAELPPPPAPPPPSLATWQASAPVRALRDRTRNMSVLLVTIDALRFDLLAPGAPHRDDFPRLARLVDDSVSFVRAIAPATSTDVSLSTLLTGRADPYQPIATTLLEALRDAGRRTYSAMPNEVTRYVGDVLIGRGVDHPTAVRTDGAVTDVGDHVSAAATSNVGLAALADAAGRPFAIWLHYFDVHEHHQIAVPQALLAKVHDTGGGPVALGYRALLAAIDREVGRVLDDLAARGLADQTILVFASDHGESLGEDPRLGETHGRVVYAPLARIPLALHVPGVAPGTRLDPVSLVDVAPTLLGLLGIALPSDGTDLLPAMLDAPLLLRPSHPLVIHEEWQWGVVDWPYQLIVRPGDNLVELYDLERDPTEHHALALPDVTRRLRAAYSASPPVRVDRTPAGRQWREQQARPPRSRAPR